MTPLDSTLARLLALHPKRIDLSLDRMCRILGALGRPERRLPPVIHVAGTNGKGSTLAYLRAIGEAAGLKVHALTSPHTEFAQFGQGHQERGVVNAEVVAEDVGF